VLPNPLTGFGLKGRRKNREGERKGKGGERKKGKWEEAGKD